MCELDTFFFFFTNIFNASDEDGKKLFNAAKNNDLKTVKFFVEERNVSITVVDNLRRSLAHVAAKNGHLEVVEYVVKKKPSILLVTDKRDYTVLRLAVKADAVDVVRYLVEEYETKMNDRDLKCAAMHTAVKFDRLPILKYFIEEKKFDVNALGEWEDRPLVFSAVSYRHQDIVDYLVQEKQVNLTLLDGRNENILYVTVRTDNLPYMKYLLEQKGVPLDINWKNLFGETLVFRAVSLNRTNIVEYLVDERHADVNIASDGDELTPLHCAAIQNNFDMCRYLVERGANASAIDKTKQSPAHKTNYKQLKLYLKTATESVTNRHRRGVPLLAECWRRRTNLLAQSI
jgi:ankyrin repeat protein